jgi:hypothetical protein
MSNNYFHNPQTIERALKHMHLAVTIGAAGVPTLIRGLGVTSIVRNSAGLYTITLPKFYKFVSANFIEIFATPENFSWQILAVNEKAGTIQFACLTAGVETDMSSGAVLKIDLYYKNTVVKN